MSEREMIVFVSLYEMVMMISLFYFSNILSNSLYD
jgi:hypothetical protein